MFLFDFFFLYYKNLVQILWCFFEIYLDFFFFFLKKKFTIFAFEYAPKVEQHEFVQDIKSKLETPEQTRRRIILRHRWLKEHLGDDPQKWDLAYISYDKRKKLALILENTPEIIPPAMRELKQTSRFDIIFRHDEKQLLKAQLKYLDKAKRQLSLLSDGQLEGLRKSVLAGRELREKGPDFLELKEFKLNVKELPKYIQNEDFYKFLRKLISYYTDKHELISNGQLEYTFIMHIGLLFFGFLVYWFLFYI